MFVHLTIAQMAVFAPTVIGIGFAVGFLSGLFGVGGGFLITPLLMLLGVPTAVAVATGANQAVATSASAALAQWMRGNVDFKMAGFLIAGGGVGSWLGVYAVKALSTFGQTDLVVAICYAVLLGLLGAFMLAEGGSAILRRWRPQASGKPISRAHHTWIHRLPLKTRFRTSKLYMSVIPPIALGVLVGVLGAVMGVGGGFILVPAMVYLLKIPTRVVIGTSLVQVVVVSTLVTILHATNTHAVDVQLAALLILGGVIGAPLGAQAGMRIQAEELRALLGLLVLSVGARFALQLLLEPDEPFNLG